MAIGQLLRFYVSLMFVFQIVLFTMMPPGFVVDAQMSVEVKVTLRNLMDPGDVVSMDCMLNDLSINPKGFLTGGAASGSSGSTVVISEEMTDDDAIFCDFKLGFVARDLIQVVVQCSANGVCSPLSVDFTRQGVYFNLTNGNEPSGLPDMPWSTLLPSQPHS